MKKIAIFLLTCSIAFASETTKEKPTIEEILENDKNVPGFVPDENIDKTDGYRILEKTFTVMMENKINVFVPLEIVTDIDIEATVIENQQIKVPFDIELNRKPEKQGHYIVKFTETEIDIDEDGAIDTYIYTPEFLEEKINKGNYVEIFGEKISEEGTYNRKVYMMVDVKS